MWKICQKSKLKHIIIQTSIHYVVQRQNDSWNRPLWLLLFLQICGLLIFGLCMGSLTFCLTFMHRSTRQQKQTETNNGKQGSLKATCSFLHSLESQCSKKRKGCRPHLLTRQHSPQYVVWKLGMINTQKAGLPLTWVAEP